MQRVNTMAQGIHVLIFIMQVILHLRLKKNFNGYKEGQLRQEG